MTGTALEKLFFTITLLDKVSGPSKGVCKSFQKMQLESKAAFQDMGKGALGIAATGASLTAFSDPARDYTKALKEVSSLDVSTEELEKLGAASKRFTFQFGGDAANISRSAYDIQSAIPGLAKGALAAFTYQGALLAKAGKSNAATITKYQGTMYNIFEDQAKKMGEAKWIEGLVGKTAHAIKIFKTTGDDMSAAFTNLGSSGQKAGVSLEEQLAVLGTLQGTMGGAQGGTAYRAFLNTVGRAKLTTKGGETLKFTDESGKLLPMVQVLEKIRKAVGPGQLKLADQTKLMQAFGDEGGKAVLNLLDKTESLKESIGDLSKINDSSPALKMAESMIDELERMQSSWKTLRVTIGEGVLPIVNLLLNAGSRVMAGLNWLLETIPGMKYVLGGVIVAVTALSIAFSSLFFIMGVTRMFRALRGELRIIYAWCLKNAGATHSMTLAQRLNAITQMFWHKAAARSVLISKLAAGAQWLWTAATKKGVFWSQAKVLWDKTMAIANLKLSASTGTATAATILNNNVLTMAALKTKLHVLWTGLLKTAMIGLKLAMLAGVVPAAITAAAAMTAWKVICLTASGVSWLLTSGLSVAAGAVWMFTAALLANPITWIILGVVALIGSIVLLAVYWDNVKAAFLYCVEAIADGLKWTWDMMKSFGSKVAGVFTAAWEYIVSGFDTACSLIGEYWWVLLAAITGPIGWITGLIVYFWDDIAAAGTACWDKLASGITWLWGQIQAFGGWVRDLFDGIFSWIGGLFEGIGGWIDRIAGWFGSEVKVAGKVSTAEQSRQYGATGANEQAPPVISGITAASKTQTDVAAGGVRNVANTTNNNFGGVSIYAPNGMSPGQLEEWALLQG